MSRLLETAPQDLMIAKLLEARAADAPDDIFFTWQDSSTTHREFNSGVNQMARNLLVRGIGPSTHVAVLMDTSPDYLTLWFALAKVGAVEVPLNTAYRGDLLVHAMQTSRATVCILDDRYRPQLTAVQESLTFLKEVVIREGGEPANDLGVTVSDFNALKAQADAGNLQALASFDSIGGVIFTSGTTGPSKGVMLSHHYLTSYGYMYAEINELTNDDVIFNYLPFFHLGAKFLTIATLVCHGRMHLVPRLSIGSFWDEVRAQGVTNFVAVGGVCSMLLARPPAENDSDSSIRTIYAVPDPASIHDELERRFGCRLTTVFGSTEAGLPICRSATDEYRPGSCGRISPFYEVVLVDENDIPVATGETGEIVVRPKKPWLIGSGYIGMPERTVESWRNLWLHTGDRARRDEDGFFFFEDRISDSIRRRGENISSYEVEQLIGKHPAVAEVAALPAVSEVGEDEVWILVILREGHSVTHEELLLHCEATMPYFMIPRYIEIVTELPRTPTAKVEKYKLRKAGPSSATWDRDRNGWALSRRGLERLKDQAAG